jgi:LDH2 family malate/lactate/ureidoglycolate dehydrogenase
MPAPDADRYPPDELRRFAAGLFLRAGMDPDKADTVGKYLLAGDLLGHTTHGLSLAARYLQEIADGGMAATGEPEVVSDRGACVCWDGGRLPGVWLTARAVQMGAERAAQFGTATIVIRRSHHNACLAAYLPIATDRGYMALIASSDPHQASVAPFGGRSGVTSPNPIAVGIPTAGDPVLIDTSCSITTFNLSLRLQAEGRKFPGAWLLDREGRATDDPEALRQGGAFLPAGGIDHGQKGYNWSWLVEALTQGLSGFGRAESPRGWGCCTFVQVIDPDAFGGGEAYRRETSWLAEACRATPPRPGVGRVRVPGEGALARRREAERDGVRLYPGILDSLRPWAEKFAVPLPAPVAPSP